VVEVETDRAAVPPTPRAYGREVLISACQPDQVALETNGHGVFTTAALGVLAKTPKLTNAAFVAAVFDVLDDTYEQRPMLSAAGDLGARGLLSSVHEALATAAPDSVESNGHRAPADVRTAAIVAILRATADLLEGGGD
jgi:hypothetical protein